MSQRQSTLLFYSGMLLSSIGSLAFSTCLVAFMLKSGFKLVEVSLILGLQRVVPIVVLGIWGHWTDRLNPKTTVIVSEIIAGIGSLAIFYLWEGPTTPYNPFLIVCVLRAFMLSFQLGSRAKISKLLSDGQYSSNSKHAIWFMKATQGAMLFSGAVAFIIIKFFSLEVAIIFDFVTFLVNGLIIFLIPVKTTSEITEVTPPLTESWTKKFSDLFKFNKEAAVLDIMLAISLLGWATFTARLAGADQSWNAIFTASYGLSVWIAGFLEESFAKRISSVPFWIVLSFSYLGLSLFNGPHYMTLAMVFIRDISYWIILHRISSHIQHDSPVGLIGGISSARFSIMVTILGLGEMFVGGWSNVVPVWADSGMRAIVAVSVGVALLMARKTTKVALSERPAL